MRKAFRLLTELKIAWNNYDTFRMTSNGLCMLTHSPLRFSVGKIQISVSPKALHHNCATDAF